MDHKLTNTKHWDAFYERRGELKSQWAPNEYWAMVLEYLLSLVIEKNNVNNILEIGCGDSPWLSYLSQKYSIDVYGIDYSEEGVKRAEERVRNLHTKSKIYKTDLFDDNIELYEKFDFVFSLGLAEHFSDLSRIIFHLKKYVKKGGILFTEIPNMQYIYGWLTQLYHPSNYESFIAYSLKDLKKAYRVNDFKQLVAGYAGQFILSTVAWGFKPKHKTIDPYVIKIVTLISCFIEKFLLNKNNFLNHSRYVAPYTYIWGRK